MCSVGVGRGERGEGGRRERGRGGGMESSRDTNTGGILPFLYIVEVPPTH